MYSFLKDQHYIWESGLSGHVVYAPKGKNLKKKLEEYLRYMLEYHMFAEMESPLIYRKEIWQNSGHWDKFQDPIVKTQSGKSFRLDKLLEDHFTEIKYENLNWNDVQNYLDNLNKSAPIFQKDKILIKDEVEWKSLMMKTTSSHHEVGLRPETATATYQNFEDNFYSTGKQYPVKVFQIGKSFRNEIATRHNLIRGREFTQLEAQMVLPANMKDDNHIILPDNDNYIYNNTINYCDNDGTEFKKVTFQQFQDEFKLNVAYFNMICLAYQLFTKLGLKEDSIRLRRHMHNEKAFYALDAWDMEVKLKDIGWTEIAGVHDRGQYDLERIITGKLKKKGIPHIIELAIGIDRLMYSILDNLFEQKDVMEGKSMLTIPYFLAPVQVSVLPLLKNNSDLCTMATKVYHEIRPYFTSEYNSKDGIGKRYLKNAIKGIPYSLTIDHESLENGEVTVRDRNTEDQVRVKVEDLVGHLFKKLSMGNLLFSA